MTRRAEDATRAGTAMSLRRIVAVVALARSGAARVAARVPAARVRLNVITARTSQALFAGGWALQQLWLFWVAPIIGGIVGGLIHRSVLADDHAKG